VHFPRHCPSHGWTTRVRAERGGPPAPPEVTAFCPAHGWTSYVHDEGGPSATAPHVYGLTPRRSPSPTYSPIHSSPSYSSSMPPYTPMPPKNATAASCHWCRRASSLSPPWPRAAELRPSTTTSWSTLSRSLLLHHHPLRHQRARTPWQRPTGSAPAERDLHGPHPE
jgi:hypothetical protein